MKNLPCFVITVGRRKIALANLKLLPGSGNIKINGGTPATSSTGHQNLSSVEQLPFILSEHLHFDVKANVLGGGLSGQIASVQLALFRSLIITQPKNRSAFRKKGFLTRDSREKERRKYGLKKARKSPQFSKR